MERFINEKLVNEKLEKLEKVNEYWYKKYLEQKEELDYWKELYVHYNNKTTEYGVELLKEKRKNEQLIKYIKSSSVDLLKRVKEIEKSE